MVSELRGKFEFVRQKSIDDESLDYVDMKASVYLKSGNAKPIKSRATSCPPEIDETNFNKKILNAKNVNKPPPNKKPDHIIASTGRQNSQTMLPDLEDDYVVMNMVDCSGLKEYIPPGKDVGSGAGIAKGLHLGTQGVIGIGTGVAPRNDDNPVAPTRREKGKRNLIKQDEGKVVSANVRANNSQGYGVHTDQGDMEVIKGPISNQKEPGVRDHGDKSPQSGDFAMRRRDGKKIPPVLSRYSGVFFTEEADV